MTVHFVGIGGAGMSGIARVLAQRGVAVSGCDREESALLVQLRSEGIRCSVGHMVEHAELEEGVEGKGSIANPGVAIVPVATTPNRFGQRHRRGCHDCARWAIAQQLEDQCGAANSLAPAAAIRALVEPAAPKGNRLGKQLPADLWGKGSGRVAACRHALEYECQTLARLERKERVHIVAIERQRHRRVEIVVTDVDSGERCVLHAGDCSLVEACAASAAVPGILPVVPLVDRRYMDGGVVSATNADLAVGADRVLVLRLVPARTDGSYGAHPARLEAELAVVTADALVIAPEAFPTGSLMDASLVSPAYTVGYWQGKNGAAAVLSFWGA